MKVVINRGIGGFGLSDAAIDECIRMGMSVTTNTDYSDDVDFVLAPDQFYGKYWCPRSHKREFRCDQRLVQVVERLGEAADGRHATLKVVDIPFEVDEGWYIAEDDAGVERINECHRSWW